MNGPLGSTSGPKHAINMTLVEEKISTTMGLNSHFLANLHTYMIAMIAVIICMLVWPIVKMCVGSVINLLIKRRSISDDRAAGRSENSEVPSIIEKGVTGLPKTGGDLAPPGMIPLDEEQGNFVFFKATKGSLFEQTNTILKFFI